MPMCVSFKVGSHFKPPTNGILLFCIVPPDRPFHNSLSQNLSLDVSELHNLHWCTVFKALKWRKSRSGCLVSWNLMLPTSMWKQNAEGNYRKSSRLDTKLMDGKIKVNLLHERVVGSYVPKPDWTFHIFFFWWRERRPFVISASWSLDLVDLHGVGGLAGTITDQSRGRGSISYHPIPLARPKS